MHKIIIENELIEKIESLLITARKNVATHINRALLATYMEIGREIVLYQKLMTVDEDGKRKGLRYISKTLTKKYGNGFSIANLHNMMIFYIKISKRLDTV